MIGFIGLGIMGSRMANNLLKNGYKVILYNRSKAKADPLLKEGAIWADSPRQVAQQADIIFTMLANPQVVESAALGKDGFLDEFPEGRLWVDCSTVDPSFTRKMAEEASRRHIRFLDAPVAGSKIPAEKGELVFLVGGNKEDLEEARPMMELMGKAIQHQGENGKGSSMKLVVNLMLAQSMAAFSEALTLGESMGLDKETVMNTLLGGVTAAPFLNSKRDKLLYGDYGAEFPLEHLQKDLQLVSQAAYEHQVSLPIANVTKEIYGLAKQFGYSKDDFSAIYKFLNTKE
ncbi:3-hydroxyisobutyrate dehydrogenase/glyoxylate/succinic semialdehyde reductase [Peribacillus deserti]|uniref:3-hydroxyisobutyrate dehydrogenase/glyoxylate/succinic semialdehyde reductase n=1 Tax=Peribacillus deserti TaxID=673318 RepID=A0ABS2QLI2_9BACI|nr:NAD(P)-dependent oxidoreductase [Peribacillus deserti]MBM7693629.1 3-hydroxyisobutyrate dehydrogenase/glyoxylate/succinic semialdehyde reductase [Peribacillus deserti]